LKNKFKISQKYKKYLRPTAGVICLVLGSVFMLIPFIPLGYILIFAGLFLLAAEIPFLRKYIDKIRKRDAKGRVDKVERSVEHAENKVTKQ
jgi:uncharacterized membrane protein